MSLLFTLALAGLTVAAVLVLFRLLAGPTTSDRIVASDQLLLIVTSAVAIRLAQTDELRFAPVLIVVALLAFLGTTTAARFLERESS